MAKVIFEFDYYEDAEELAIFRESPRMATALNEIYNVVRTELKHGDEELSSNINHLLEIIKESSGEFV